MLERKHVNDILLIGYAKSGDTSVLTVGVKRRNDVMLINAFKGEEATELWEKLLGEKNKPAI